MIVTGAALHGVVIVEAYLRADAKQMLSNQVNFCLYVVTKPTERELFWNETGASTQKELNSPDVTKKKRTDS